MGLSHCERCGSRGGDVGVWDIAAGLNKCREVHGLVWGGGDEVWESETSREQTLETECSSTETIA